MPSAVFPLLAGVVLQFTWLCLYRAIMTKFPLDLIAVVLALFPLVGFAAGLIPTARPRRYSWLPWVALAVSAACLAIGNGTNLHFLVSRIYYPYPIPVGAWVRIPAYAGMVLAPSFLFFQLGSRLRENHGPAGPLLNPFPRFFLGAALAYPAAHGVSVTIGPYYGSLAGCVLLHVVSNRGLPAKLAAAFLLATAGIAMMMLPEQYFTWRATEYRVKESSWTPHYRLSFISFKDDQCLGGVFNQLMIWYTCKDYDDLPRESRWTSEAFTEGRRRILSMGRTDGMTARAALRANPDVEKIVVVEIDPDVVHKAREFSKEYHDGAYEDPRVRVLASDWRTFLRSDTDTYDLIYLDGLGIRLLTEPLTTIPQENFLFTREAFADMFEKRLTPDGVIAANWGSTRKEEAFDILASLPEGVQRRAFWGTISNYPFTGLGLFFTIASRDEESLRRIGDRILAAGNLQEIPVPVDLSRIAISDRSPFLQHGLQAMILVPSIPLTVLLFGVFFYLRRKARAGDKLTNGRQAAAAEIPPRPPFEKGGNGGIYGVDPGVVAGVPAEAVLRTPVLWGVALGALESLTVSWVSRRCPWGPSLGWMITGAVFALGLSIAGVTGVRARGARGVTYAWLMATGLGMGLALADVPLVLSILGMFLSALGIRTLLAAQIDPAKDSNIFRAMASERAGYALGLYVIQFVTYAVGFSGAAVSVAALLGIVALLPRSGSGGGRDEGQPNP